MVDHAHRALAHPVRSAVLAVLRERGEASPKEIAGVLGIPLERTSYHVRGLVRARLAELARTSHKRGAVVHHYRPVDTDAIGVRLRIEPARATAFERELRALVERERAAGNGAVQGDAVELTLILHRDVAQSAQSATDT